MKPRRIPAIMWVLHDTSNSNPWSRNYLWCHKSRVSAVKQLRLHRENVGRSNLIGPFKYALVPSGTGKLRTKLNRQATHFKHLPSDIWVTDDLRMDPRNWGALYADWHETREIARENIRHSMKTYGWKIDGPYRYEAVRR